MAFFSKLSKKKIKWPEMPTMPVMPTGPAMPKMPVGAQSVVDKAQGLAKTARANAGRP